jgi:hypothetical protein
MKLHELSLSLAHLPYNSAQVEEELRVRVANILHEPAPAKRVSFSVHGPQFFTEPKSHAEPGANESLLKAGVFTAQLRANF